jgi:hypothetical protein
MAGRAFMNGGGQTAMNGYRESRVSRLTTLPSTSVGGVGVGEPFMAGRAFMNGGGQTAMNG